MKNNKGVTLVELLIVIVVMGIISAFAIPAVGTIIENTQKDAVYADALAVESAAKLYCSQTTCDSDQTLTEAQLTPYVEGLDWTAYTTTCTKTAAGWLITLESDSDDGSFEWTPAAVPSAGSRANVSVDAD